MHYNRVIAVQVEPVSYLRISDRATVYNLPQLYSKQRVMES